MMEQPTAGKLVYGHFTGDTAGLDVPVDTRNANGSFRDWAAGERLLIYEFHVTALTAPVVLVVSYGQDYAGGDPSINTEYLRFNVMPGVTYTFPNAFGNYLAFPPTGKDVGTLSSGYAPVVVRASGSVIQVDFAGLVIGGSR